MSASGRSGLGGDRRLRRLRLALLAVGAVLALRVAHVQLVEHEKWRTRGEGQWGREIPIDAERGNLYDRHGRPLALSVTTHQIGVSRRYITDLEGLAATLGEVLDRDPRVVARRIERADGPHVVLASGVLLTEEDKEKLRRWQAATMDERCSRYYPTDGVGASFVGFFRQDPKQTLATGLELSLDGELAGQPGLAREIRTGKSWEELGRVVLQKPAHGRSLTLTLDADLQILCEDQLRLAMAATGSASGSVLILDPSNGDVLAAASAPLMETRRGRHGDPAVWINRNFTTEFEPGSLFKVFSTCVLLHNAAIDTATVFNCDGTFMRIGNDNDHDYGDLPLMRAFSLSSNVYFAKAAMNLRAQELYRDLANLGFGRRTAFPYPAQVDGTLHPVSSWSKRSQPTIAIGQELTATSLQLGLALCAVANGGTLFAPRAVREIRDAAGDLVEEIPPVPLRRVMTPALAGLLRDAMARVVHEGTGADARLDWISTGGKTGTAQKSVDGRGFTPGAYVASFGGLVPIENPRLVILAVLDEPHGQAYYAARSAVPLFRALVGEIRRCTTWLQEVPGEGTDYFSTPDPGRLVVVPDVMYLSVGTAVQHLAARGLKPVGDERAGTVVQQIPAPGTRCARGQAVGLTVSGDREPITEQASLCPDFTGMSNRQIRGLSARLGIPVVIDGVGYARRQDVRPGGACGTAPVTVRMASPWH